MAVSDVNKNNTNNYPTHWNSSSRPLNQPTQPPQGVAYTSGAPQDPMDSLNFGLPGYTPGYDSNSKGSAANAYNTQLSQFTPDQLINRYQQQGRNFNNGTWDSNYSNAYNSFKQQIGRDPTSSEFAQLLPAFQQSITAGNAIIGSMRDRLSQNPNDPMNQGKSGQYGGQIGQVFQSMLGRGATPEEINHFGSLMATGNVDAYQLQDFLRGTPEYQIQADTKFRGGLSDELVNSDAKFFDRAKQGLQSQFMQNGTGNSSALDSALTDLMGQISQQRGQYLAGLSAQQYGGNKDLALSNYGNTQNQMMNSMNQNRQYSQGQQNYFTGRNDEIADYNRQMGDYLKMNSSGRGGNPLYALGGGLVGAGIGGFAGGPAGAGAGYQIGSGAGAGFGYLGGR